MVIITFGENAAFHLRQLQAGDLVFLQSVQVIETLQEKQIGICSMTSRGLEMPPVQKAFQSASILLRISPVNMVLQFCSKRVKRARQPISNSFNCNGKGWQKSL